MDSLTHSGRKMAHAPALSVSTAPQARPRPATGWDLLPCSAATALLLYLSHFPVAWGWLGWIALVPLLVLVRSPLRARTIFLVAWVAGLAFFFPVLQWMRVADPRMYVTWILLAIYCSLYFPAGIMFVRALDRRHVPLVIALPVVWTALEFLRAHLMGGFPWYFLAHGQHDFLPIIQFSDITGAWGVSFLVAAVNAIIFEWLWSLRTPVRRSILVFQSAVVLLLFTALLWYGSWRMEHADFRPGPKLALIQGNVEQRIRKDKRDPDEEKRLDALRRLEADYQQMTELALQMKPDAIVYPETSYMHDWHDTDNLDALPEQDRRDIQRLRQVLKQDAHGMVFEGHRPLVLLGLNAVQHFPGQEPPRKRYNSALLLSTEGQALGRYDKIHRVPFGEYVPLRETFPFMNRFAPYDYDYSIAAGESQALLPLGSHRFGVVICYEDTDTTLAREYVDPAQTRKADFLVNISNDGWFDGTAEHEQHLAICRFRAIETRRSIARSVNMGISAVVDGNGRVLAPDHKKIKDGANLWTIGDNPLELPVSRWSEFKKVPGIVFAAVPLDGRDSLYARWGDWLPWTCWGVLALLLIAPWFRRLRLRGTGTSA
jgi:apolipoprotein N-acyltransferase